MVFTYKMEEHMDPESGWRVVSYKEFAAKMAAFILYEVWDNFRLWELSRDMIRLIEGLDLEVVLGNAANADALRALLEVIRNTRFPGIPNAWRARGTMQSWSLGWRGACGDWVYYDPKWRMYIHSKAEGRVNALNRDIPDGHPRGWNYDAFAEGWQDPDPVADGADAADGGWIDDIADDDDVGGGAGGACPAANPATPSSAGSSGIVGVVDRHALRVAVEEVSGVPESGLNSLWDGIIGYLRWRLSDK